ncbi:ATP-dependent DNA helicase DDX31-like isoform X1 [Apostichopus japonicus]|uniref:ATP-dependent DNA helicase DDX31-like isoform X1 n=1 Tax=Stichopus japonicus TaxID=307972 RepID=UPI003AB2915D
MDGSGGLMLNIFASNKFKVPVILCCLYFPFICRSVTTFLGRKPDNERNLRKRKWMSPRENDTAVEGSSRNRRNLKGTDSTENKGTLDGSEKKRARRDDKPGQTPQYGSGQVFSSLFRKNPDIPKLMASNVQQTKEDVFSIKFFKELNLHPFMISNLEKQMGFEHATSVQAKAIPVVMKGGDVLVKSQTGSGKTLAFSIPIIQSLQCAQPKVQRSDGVYAVILAPTRELALQSFETLQTLVKPFNWIVPGCITGGERKKSEKARLRKGVNVLVATPGRLVDHILNTSSLQFWKLRWLVLDEADRLLDMGFEKDVAAILNAINSQSEGCQRLLLSATLTQGVERLAGIALTNPTFIDVAKDEAVVLPSTKDQSDYVPEEELLSTKPTPVAEEEDFNFTIPDTLEQYYMIVPSKLRLVTLFALILSKSTRSSKTKMLIFLSNRDSVEFHYNLLNQMLCPGGKENANNTGLKIFRLHGSMEQKVRRDVYEEFHNKGKGILLCTDVAARGLDLPDVDWIVQYNTPGTPAEYVHRVGRTARVGRLGHAVIFLGPSEAEYVKTLQGHKISVKAVDYSEILQTLVRHAPAELLTEEHFNGRPPKTMEEAATRLQKKLENYVHSESDHTKLAQQAYHSFIRAYATYPSSLKHIFHIKKLHLGHVAKSFGLREAPSKFKSQGPKLTATQKHALQQQRRGQTHGKGKKKRSDTSEFGSGLDGQLASPKAAKMTNQKRKMSKQRKVNR